LRGPTNAPITSTFKGSVALGRFDSGGNSLETNVSAASRSCGISTSSSPSGVCRWRGPVAVALAGQRVRPALVALSPEEGAELLLDRTLDDQLSTEAGELRKRALGVACRQAPGEQGVGLLLDLRRRRYGAFHGVGPLRVVVGPEGTYAVP
jgi:hypothetical protein